MAELRASTLSPGVTPGTPIAKARKYLGCVVIGAGAAVTAVVYKGAAATAGQEIGGANAAANASMTDDPASACDTDNGLFVVTTGAGGVFVIRYST